MKDKDPYENSIFFWMFSRRLKPIRIVLFVVLVVYIIVDKVF